MGHTSILCACSWAAGLPPCWLLRRARAAGEPGLGARQWEEQPGRNWEESGIPREWCRSREGWCTPGYSAHSVSIQTGGAPSLPGSPQGSTRPSRQMLAAGRNPALEALSSGGPQKHALSPNRDNANDPAGHPQNSSHLGLCSRKRWEWPKPGACDTQLVPGSQYSQQLEPADLVLLDPVSGEAAVKQAPGELPPAAPNLSWSRACPQRALPWHSHISGLPCHLPTRQQGEPCPGMPVSPAHSREWPAAAPDWSHAGTFPLGIPVSTRPSQGSQTTEKGVYYWGT